MDFTELLEWTDHPHACGENPPLKQCPQHGHGPSPRVWGEQNGSWRTDFHCRTIPTRVGRTASRVPASRCLSDHPHACGENFAVELGSNPRSGPSPRVWGERVDATARWGVQRTIPTRVGRTERHEHFPDPRADHPHACGENSTGLTSSTGSTGPSPRVWGELACSMVVFMVLRTIPTRVGRTDVSSAALMACPDHPHACGENPWAVASSTPLLGPSPRVWGERGGRG